MSIIVTVVTGLVFVPISVTGFLARVTGWTNIVSYIDNRMKVCTDCYRYSINWIVYIIELVFVFFIGLIVLLCGVGIVYANTKPVESKQ